MLKNWTNRKGFRDYSSADGGGAIWVVRVQIMEYTDINGTITSASMRRMRWYRWGIFVDSTFFTTTTFVFSVVRFIFY